MIDLKHLRDNPEVYKKGAQDKGIELDWNRFFALDEEVRALKTAVEQLQAEKNTLTKEIEAKQKAGEEFKPIIEQVRELKAEIDVKDEELTKLQAEFDELALHIPNPPAAEVHVGHSDEDNTVDEYVGDKPEFDFTPKTHWELLEAKGWLDQERAVKMSGSRFQLMKGPLAQLALALVNRSTQKLIGKGFTFAMVPQLVRDQALVTTGFLPNDAMNIYRVNPALSGTETPREEDDLWLIGTGEVPLVAQHIDETIAGDELPLRYVGFSSCYRREAGTYGKDTKGLIRLHQFEKVEMVSFVRPQDSTKEHDYLLQIEEEIFQELEIPYQRINICTGDLGAPAVKKYDLEAWFPGMDIYKEVTSTSNTTDFQTRRGRIKYDDGTDKDYLHALNGTVIAVGRALAAIVENNQTAEGDIRIPTVLQPFMGGLKQL